MVSDTELHTKLYLRKAEMFTFRNYTLVAENNVAKRNASVTLHRRKYFLNFELSNQHLLKSTLSLQVRIILMQVTRVLIRI